MVLCNQVDSRPMMPDEQYQFTQIGRSDVYLDIWRGAFYSVMLGVIYNFIVPNSQVGLLTLFIISFVTVYLVSDGITRYNSRRIIQRLPSSSIFFNQVILLVIEMIGLLAFVTWINNVPWNINGILKDKGYIAALGSLLENLAEGNKSFAAFCLMNVCHNSYFIWKDRDCGFRKFLEHSLIKDASEMANLSDRWVSSLTIDKKASLISLKKRLVQGELFSAFWEVIKLSGMHLKAQWIALHTVFFNMLAMLAIGFLPKERLLEFSFKWGLISLIVPVLTLFICYGLTSYYEMKRMGNKDSSQPSCFEKVFQAAGNISLILFWMVIFLVSPKSVMVFLVLLMGCIFDFLLIYLSKGPKPEPDTIQNQPD